MPARGRWPLAARTDSEGRLLRVSGSKPAVRLYAAAISSSSSLADDVVEIREPVGRPLLHEIQGPLRPARAVSQDDSGAGRATLGVVGRHRRLDRRL